MFNNHRAWRDVVSLIEVPLVVIDVGARAGIDESWLAFAPHVQLYGFEPDAAECARLNASADASTEYVSVALWSAAGDVPFYVTQDPMCSSLYPPIEELAVERPRLAHSRTRTCTTIAVRTLDDWARERAIERVDCLKLDAQGAELAILRGGVDVLRRVRAVKTEVQFNAQYEGVPLFADVDSHMRAQGFALWRLSALSHCGFAGTHNANIPEYLDYDEERVSLTGGGGQLLWADAYFVRDEVCHLSAEIDWQDAIRDACLAVAHGYVDLAEASVLRSLATAPAPVGDILRAVLNPDAFDATLS
jgi:FkbM family methyltransferase